MARIKILFRVLLSSPSDLSVERKIVEKIVDEINDANKLSAYGLELVCWENDVSPQIIMESGQILIDEAFSYKESDLLIGMFYKKLGTPVMGSESGTIHEIEKAIESYKEIKKPEIKLYFKKVSSMLSDTSKNERDEYERVENKCKEFMQLGIVQRFKTNKEFESICRKQITEFFNNKRQEAEKYQIISENKIIVKNRAEFERMEEIVKQATRDIFILGINLECALNMIDLLINKATEGVRINLLALDPLGKTIEHFNINDIDTDYRRKKIISNLEILAEKFKDIENIELRKIDNIFVSGCTCVDINTNNGRIIAQHYLNFIGTSNAPILDIYAKTNNKVFSAYKESLFKLWERGQKYTL